jgi:hypothetical protein
LRSAAKPPGANGSSGDNGNGSPPGANGSGNGNGNGSEGPSTGGGGRGWLDRLPFRR